MSGGGGQVLVGKMGTSAGWGGDRPHFRQLEGPPRPPREKKTLMTAFDEYIFSLPYSIHFL